MLSKQEIELRKTRQESLRKIGLGATFAKSVIGELQVMQKLGDSQAQIDQTAATARANLENTYQSLSQNDANRAILSGLDINSGTVSQVAKQRLSILAAENKRLDDARSKAKTSITEQENTSILTTAAEFLFGALGWLLI